MPFTPENQQWIRDEIDRAIRTAINPLTRTKKLLRALKDWGLTAIIWAVPVGLLGISVALGIRVVSDIREETKFRTETGRDINDIKESLLIIRSKAAASDPSDPRNQAEAASVLATAKRNQFGFHYRSLSKAESSLSMQPIAIRERGLSRLNSSLTGHC